MNILYCTNYLSNSTGGSEYVFWLYAKFMAERGHKVYVVCFNTDEEVREITSALGIEVINIAPELKPTPFLPRGLCTNMKYILMGYRKARTKLSKVRVDIIHSNTYTPIILGSMLRNRYGMPHVVTVHDVKSSMDFPFIYQIFYEVEPSHKVTLIKSRLSMRGERLLYRYAKIDAIVVPSFKTKHDIEKIIERSREHRVVRVIPNGIDLIQYYKVVDEGDITYDDLTILYVGRLTFYKNLRTVLLALKTVRRVHPEVKFLIVGSGPASREYLYLIRRLGLEGNVMMLGSVSHEEKVRLIAKSLFVVYPSIFEGFGITILEAWALKKPVIVSAISPLKDIVDHLINGIHVSPFKIKAWHEAIISLIEDVKFAKQLGENGFKKVLSEYDYKKVLRNLERLYERLAT
ncbi:MAG: hypothetical protein DRJ66_00645 [Thermoprotei archaeon]|mgnify:CR=1 FL=1|nr:MAG: hypothetical protein DRJ66_00645 [Thermoprotei archaeon]RLF19437.1 MAG: hypothetical protein DRZ82_05690 [Thermoprotei archaeon]